MANPFGDYWIPFQAIVCLCYCSAELSNELMQKVWNKGHNPKYIGDVILYPAATTTGKFSKRKENIHAAIYRCRCPENPPKQQIMEGVETHISFINSPINYCFQMRDDWYPVNLILPTIERLKAKISFSSSIYRNLLLRAVKSFLLELFVNKVFIKYRIKHLKFKKNFQLCLILLNFSRKSKKYKCKNFFILSCFFQ